VQATADDVCVQVEAITLRAWATECRSLHPDAMVTVAIRPEQMRLYAEPSPNYDNHLLVVVEEVIYLGMELRYLLRLSEQYVLVHRQQNTAVVPQFPQGAQVFACFSAQSARVLQDESPVGSTG
jgi:ABC-type Fe3+/spermidine/putrescine transport system ATPase subunit